MKDRLSVLVFVTDWSEEVTLRQKVVNFYDPNARKFIAKTAWWAMHNGHVMTTYPVESDEDWEEIDNRQGNVVRMEG